MVSIHCFILDLFGLSLNDYVKIYNYLLNLWLFVYGININA